MMQLCLPTEATDDLPQRPKTRGECVDGPRPCPWLGCRHNLHVDVSSDGNITFPRATPEEMRDSCVLDVVDRHPHGATLDEIGMATGVTKERIRCVEADGLRKMVGRSRLAGLVDQIVRSKR